MMSAFEAKRLSKENYERIKATNFNRLVKDIEQRIEEAINCGRGYIPIRRDLGEFDELRKYFDAFGYEMMGIRYCDSDSSSLCEKYFLVWDEEKFEKEITVIANGGKKFFEGESV